MISDFISEFHIVPWVDGDTTIKELNTVEFYSSIPFQVQDVEENRSKRLKFIPLIFRKACGQQCNNAIFTSLNYDLNGLKQDAS
jgi:hypothetical protein